MLSFIGFACVIAFHYYAAKESGMSAVLWAILGAVLPLISTSVLIYIIFQRRKYIGLPTFQEYLELHSKSPDDRNIYCSSCGSSSIGQWRISSPPDPRRVHFCNTCNTSLFRSGF